MNSDNKVSTFLLLILIGLSIYLLLNRCNISTPSNNNSRPELFSDLNSQSSNNNSQYMNLYNVVGTDNPPLSNSQFQSLLNPISDKIAVVDLNNQPNGSNVNIPVNNNSSIPVNNNSSIPVNNQSNSSNNNQSNSSNNNQSNSSNNNQSNSSNNNQSNSSNNNQSNSSNNNQSNASGSNVSLFNFAPNDESIFDDMGTNLNDAFLPPIPAGLTTDSLDFKKQNMDNYNAKDFLPHEINDEWFQTDFSLAKYQLNDDKLINTERYIIGINTVGQSLKNASYDIRGTIPNPKFVISPWNNSTMEPDFNLKPLC